MNDNIVRKILLDIIYLITSLVKYNHKKIFKIIPSYVVFIDYNEVQNIKFYEKMPFHSQLKPEKYSSNKITKIHKMIYFI